MHGLQMLPEKAWERAELEEIKAWFNVNNKICSHVGYGQILDRTVYIHTFIQQRIRT